MPLDNLPNELIDHIAAHLESDLTGLWSWSRTSKHFHSLLTPARLPAAAAVHDETVHREPFHLMRAARGGRTAAFKGMIKHVERYKPMQCFPLSMWHFPEPLLLHLCALPGVDPEMIKAVLDTGAFPVTEVRPGTAVGTSDTALHKAARQGNVAVMKVLIDAGAVVNTTNDEGMGMTPLHEAAVVAALAAVDLLLMAGADPAVDAYHGWTPLSAAAMGNSTDVVRQLVETGAYDGEKRDSILSNALAGGCCRGDGDPIEVARLLLELGAIPSQVHLCLACEKNHVNLVKLLLDAGADPKGQDDKGQTVFHYVKSLEVAEMLYKVTCSTSPGLVSAACDLGKTALDKLYQETYSNEFTESELQIAEWLVEHGCGKMAFEPNGYDRRNALHYAAYYAHPSVIKRILHVQVAEPSSLINRTTMPKQTALHMAADGASGDIGDRVECIRLLVHHGCNVQMQDQSGNTALHSAFTNLRAPAHTTLLTRCLIAAGIDVSVRSNLGETALLRAMKGRQTESALLLIDAGTDLSAPVSDAIDPGMTVLHHAARIGMLEVVKRLLQPDLADSIDFNAQTQSRQSYTALHCAVKGHLRSGLPNDYYWGTARILLGQLIPEGDQNSRRVLEHDRVISLLCASGRVDTSAKNAEGLTPLDMVLHHCNRHSDEPVSIATILEAGLPKPK
ncbi:Ankyrin repeat domain-containing protein 42 [Onygenales sp. PD_40]|nr:Ankyrin repeat domain-containing protein 42 [Onygenales sp. PD_40]KAK2807134.1 Ankyrin repeat domain-containing protein 42 [Onygenales sp. PD_10]